MLPAPQAHTPLVLNSPAGILAAGQSFAPPLAAGQRLAVFVPGTAGVEDKAIQSVTTTAGAARLAWTPRLQRAWTGGSVVRWMRKLRLFGSGGPDAWLRPTVRGGVITFASENIDYSIAGGATQLSLDAIYDTLQPGQRLLIAAPTFTRMIDVTSVVQHSPPPLGPLNSTVTRVEFGAAQSLPAIADSRTVFVYEVSGPDIQFAALEYLPSIAGNRVYVRTLNATGLTKRKTLILDDEQVSPAFGVITNVAPNTPNAEHVELTLDPALSRALDTATAFAYGNVTKATHGETVPAEILGNGDAGTPFQQFRLAKPPLTYVPKPGAPNGADSTLELRV
ncbi:MAG TPA: hypothetical protein VNM37_21385, partial [Candidatus Dormibacteraeota bacterium]|nr:hypothetical protein [Candidatus Dormibacteraeota bacterium]